MTLYGGRRARAVRSSLYHYLDDSLTSLGWYDSNANFTPVSFIDEIPNFEAKTVIKPNTLALIDGESDSSDIELGSFYGEHHWAYSIELYAENDAVGLMLIKDIQAVLEGRYPGVSNSYPQFTLYDYAQSSPEPIGYVDVENIAANRMSGPQPWMRYWYAVKFELVDYQLD